MTTRHLHINKQTNANDGGCGDDDDDEALDKLNISANMCFVITKQIVITGDCHKPLQPVFSKRIVCNK